MKPRILIYFSLIAIAIVAGVAVSQSTPVTIGLYVPDKLNTELVQSLAERLFPSHNVEIVSFYNLAEIENSPKLVLFIGSSYPTLIYSNAQNGNVFLESNQVETVSLIASRSTKTKALEDLKGSIVGVGPVDDSLSFLLGVFALSPIVDDIRFVPDRMGIYSIPNSTSLKVLDRQDRRAQLSHNRISAAFFEEKEDSSYGRLIYQTSAPKLFITSTSNTEENSRLKELLMAYEPTNPDPPPTTSMQRVEIQDTLSKLGYSFTEPKEFTALQNQYKKYKENLPY